VVPTTSAHISTASKRSYYLALVSLQKKITIVSDGGLAAGWGLFGWKIISSDNVTLYAGAGPINGPMEEGSSTRRELGGQPRQHLCFLVVSLARSLGTESANAGTDGWSIVRPRFRQVKVTTRVSHHQLRRAPNNSDYLMVTPRPTSRAWQTHRIGLGQRTPGHGYTPFEHLGTSAKTQRRLRCTRIMVSRHDAESTTDSSRPYSRRAYINLPSKA
jgi:hypothetical protein